MIALLCALLAATGPYAAGLKLLRGGRPAEALPLLEQAQRRDPANAAVAADLGTALLRLGRRAEAEQQLRAAIAKDPRRWPAFATLASLLSEDPRRWDLADETIALLDRGLGLARGEAAPIGLHLARADFLRSVGRTAEARAELESLLRGESAPAQQRRIADLLDRVAADERLRAGEDWPEPEVTAADRADLARAEQDLRRGDSRAALGTAEKLCASHGGWRAPRWLRARALEELGRVDEAARELAVLVQLAPSQGRAWRKLGELLAAHGGLLEAERADQALRQALALEPSWTDLWLVRARLALRRGRPSEAVRALTRLLRDGSGDESEVKRLLDLARAQADLAPPAGAPSRAPEPSPEARELFRQAQEALAAAQPGESAQALLARALEASPGFVDAAAAWVALGGELPAGTRDALWGDAAALLDLTAQVQRARPGDGPALAAPWVDRAVELGAPEARFQRALLRLAAGDRPGALGDLTEYAASAPPPAHLEEARGLRARLVPAAHVDPAEAQARARLAEDRPEAALVALGGRCEAGRPAGLLLAIAQVREYSGDLSEALACYRATRAADPGSAEAAERFARAAARAPAAEVEPYAEELRAAAASGTAAAEWALARLDLAHGRPDEALVRLDAFLRAAAPDEPGLGAARATRDRLLRASDDAARTRWHRRAALAGAAALVLFAAAIAWLRGSTVSRALARRPRLYPAVARTVAALRHDVLKHRASVLSAALDPGAREEVARALLQPEPVSRTVAQAYQRLRQEARAQGVSLRPLAREPVFGPLVRDLAAAESVLRKPSTDPAPLAAIDGRLRELHGPALADLLRRGPRTRLSARELEGWIRGIEAEVRRGGAGWSSPSILVQGMEVEFPVDREALATIFANLLRNAQAAATPGGRVLVRLGEELDPAGRRVHVLLVGDSADGELTLEAIESRESGRGLAIVRDLTREWHGHVVVRAEAAPLRKAIGACFPAGGAPA
ncbi:MAG TPA: tetratricopeptide repeat protein [Myxococcales bacterium]